MLILSRARNERIIIGDDIEILVVEIRPDKVRLGIVAPKEVSVHREEVYMAIKRERVAEAACQVEDDQPIQDKMRDEWEGRL